MINAVILNLGISVAVFVLLLVISKQPVDKERGRTDFTFIMPLAPWSHALAMFLNLSLMARVLHSAALELFLWILLGIDNFDTGCPNLFRMMRKNLKFVRLMRLMRFLLNSWNKNFNFEIISQQIRPIGGEISCLAFTTFFVFWDFSQNSCPKLKFAKLEFWKERPKNWM